MSDTTITVTLDPTTAAAYHTASTEEQQKIQLLVRLFVQEFTTATPQTLREIMDAIGAKALQRGLTPEMLEQLLTDDE
jgi:hypothetical protein